MLVLYHKFAKTTIKQNYELICMAFGEAYHKSIITENFMADYKRVKMLWTGYLL